MCEKIRHRCGYIHAPNCDELEEIRRRYQRASLAAQWRVADRLYDQYFAHIDATITREAEDCCYV